ncbi:MAG: TrkH family potassium uptake protein, partial [Bacteroidetes bacterium]
MINFRIISRVVSVLLLIVGLLMWTGLPLSYIYQTENGQAIFLAGLTSCALGGLLWFIEPGDERTLRKREGYLIVALGWLSVSLFGTLPYLFSGAIPGFSDAFFETVSGLTTTGASVLTDIEAQPKDILYWRSLTQWIGGMGIIV